jgi:hypothetical protein
MAVHPSITNSKSSARHKADMMSAAAVNKTYISPGVIKWSGFQVIGESLLNVLQCQNYPYDLGPRDEQLERAILDTPDASEQVTPITRKTDNRNWMQSLMNWNHLGNDHTQNLILQALSGYLKSFQGGNMMCIKIVFGSYRFRFGEGRAGIKFVFVGVLLKACFWRFICLGVVNFALRGLRKER